MSTVEGIRMKTPSLTYAGVGSRRTPTDVCELMTRTARALRRQGWTLRSGHAPRADQAFEAGAGDDAEIYLPWGSFEAEVPTGGAHVVWRPTKAAFEMAAEYHPSWYSLRGGVRSLHARNMHQILGHGLDIPAAFVICWTPDGSIDGSDRSSGGTGQALRVAAASDVHVFNLQLDADRELFEQLASELPARSLQT